MADKTLDEMRGLKDGLIRKLVSGGAVLIAPMTASAPTALTGNNGALQELTGFKPLGRIARDGAPTFTPDQQTEDVEAWGELQPARRDVVSKTLTVETTLIDTRFETLELLAGQSLAEVKANKTSGEYQVTDNPKPENMYYRAFLLGADGTGADAVYFGAFLPRVNITVGNQDWNPTSAVTYPLTITAFIDGKLGYSMKRYFGGPGWKNRLTDMGIATQG